MKANKRLTRIMLLVTLFGAFALAPMAAIAAPPTPGAVDTTDPIVTAPPVLGAPTTVRAYTGLRLREGPSLADPVIKILYNGEMVYPAAGPVYNEGISWTYVGVYRGGYYYEGFCASAFLANFGGYTPTGESGLKVTAPWGLRLRSGPGKGYSIKRIVPYGTILQSTGVTQWGSGIQWTQVAIDGIYLWAAGAYLHAV